MPKAIRPRRLQVDLGPRHERLLLRLRALGGSDADATRRIMEIVDNAADSIQQGFKIVLVPADDAHPDAMPELTRAVRPEAAYTYLVARPHAWRKQLFLKGLRLTVSQLVGAMRENGWSAEQAADEFDLPAAAVHEAQDYAALHADLLKAEDAEDAHAVRSLGAAAAG